MRLTLEDLKSTGGGYWLVRLTLEDLKSTGGGYRLVTLILEDVESKWKMLLWRLRGW